MTRKRCATRASSRLAVLLAITAWAAVTLAGFWAFHVRYMLPVPRPPGAAVARPERTPPCPVTRLQTDTGAIRLAAGEPLTLLNFWNPDCPCSRFAESHVRQLVRDYRPRGVRFVTLIEAAGETQESLLDRWRDRNMAADGAAVDADGRIARVLGVWAAPAAVIVDSLGRVVFVGAYNQSRYCNARRSAWAELALQDLLAGRLPRVAQTPFYGCQVIAAH